MRRNRITLGALASLALFAIPAPAALAGGPLLSGYGGPGAGAQVIIGGTLLNGPKGGSGGGSGGSPGGSSSSSSSLSSSSPSSSSSDTNASHIATGGRAASGSVGGQGSSGALRHGGEGASAGHSASAGSTGAYEVSRTRKLRWLRQRARGSRRGSPAAICWRWCWSPGCSRSLRWPPYVCQVWVLIMSRSQELECALGQQGRQRQSRRTKMSSLA